MSLYRYTAKDLSGKKFTGEVEAIDEKALVTTLQGEGLVPIEVRERNAQGSITIEKVLPKTGGVSSSEIVGFTRQLSTMISAGLPLTDALVILEKQAKNKHACQHNQKQKLTGNLHAQPPRTYQDWCF